MVTKAKPKAEELMDGTEQPWPKAEDAQVFETPSALSAGVFLGTAQKQKTGELVDEDGNATTLKAALKKDDPGFIAKFAVYERFLPPGVLEGYETTCLLIPAGHRVTQEYVDSLEVGAR